MKKVMMFILVLLVFGMGGFILYDKVLSPVKNENKKEEKVEEGGKDFSLSEAKKILEEFGIRTTYDANEPCKNNILSEYYSKGYKMYIALNRLDQSLIQEKKCTELYDDSYKVDNQMAYRAKSHSWGFCNYEESEKVYSYDEVNKIYQKMYGENMPKEGFGYGYSIYDYHADHNVFNTLDCRCGGTCGPTYAVTEVKSAKENGKILTIEVAHVRETSYKYDRDDYFIFSARGNMIDGSLDGVKTPEEFEQLIRKKYLDQLDVYEVVFEKEKEHYVLKKITKKIYQ